MKQGDLVRIRSTSNCIIRSEYEKHIGSIGIVIYARVSSPSGMWYDWCDVLIGPEVVKLHPKFLEEP